MTDDPTTSDRASEGTGGAPGQPGQVDDPRNAAGGVPMGRPDDGAGDPREACRVDNAPISNEPMTNEPIPLADDGPEVGLARPLDAAGDGADDDW